MPLGPSPGHEDALHPLDCGGNMPGPCTMPLRRLPAAVRLRDATSSTGLADMTMACTDATRNRGRRSGDAVKAAPQGRVLPAQGDHSKRRARLATNPTHGDLRARPGLGATRHEGHNARRWLPAVTRSARGTVEMDREGGAIALRAPGGAPGTTLRARTSPIRPPARLKDPFSPGPRSAAPDRVRARRKGSLLPPVFSIHPPRGRASTRRSREPHCRGLGFGV